VHGLASYHFPPEGFALCGFGPCTARKRQKSSAAGLIKAATANLRGALGNARSVQALRALVVCGQAPEAYIQKPQGKWGPHTARKRQKP
jgi:hypothetical protein